jgi:steroid 5-alpha reductase family enzyme
MAIVMALLWYLQTRSGDAGIVDIAWALGVAANAVLFGCTTSGNPMRRIVISMLVALWALRLAGHVLLRVLTMPEDGRYAVLRDRWGARHQLLLFGFFQLQASWSVLFALPMLLAMGNLRPFPQLADGIGLVVCVASVLGETVADRQLQRFRANPQNSGHVCTDGLWRYSRHPNYFFEWCHWWSYVAFAWGTPLFWISFLGPMGMLFFLLKVTGIPPTEKQALASRGDAYRAYQQTTSVFFPWPPGRPATETTGATSDRTRHST